MKYALRTFAEVFFIMRIWRVAQLKRQMVASLLRAALQLPHLHLATEFHIKTFSIGIFFLFFKKHSDVVALTLTAMTHFLHNIAISRFSPSISHTVMSSKISWARLRPGVIYDSSFDPACIKDSLLQSLSGHHTSLLLFLFFIV